MFGKDMELAFCFIDDLVMIGCASYPLRKCMCHNTMIPDVSVRNVLIQTLLIKQLITSSCQRQTSKCFDVGEVRLDRRQCSNAGHRNFGSRLLPTVSCWQFRKHSQCMSHVSRF